MGDWERSIKSDIGVIEDLQNATIDGSSPYDLNNYKVYREQNTIDGNWSVDHDSGEVAFANWTQGISKNLFGFKLKQNGSDTNLYAVCRAYPSYIVTTQGRVSIAMEIKWQYYNSSTGNYDDIATYIVDAGMGQIGSIRWNIIHLDVVFIARTETFHGVEQQMIYGGIYAWSNDSSNYGSTYTGKSLGVQGIGSVYNLSNFDPINPEEVVFSPEFGKPSKPKGGYNTHAQRKGTFDDTSDKIEVSSKPYMNPFRTGFINGYVVTPTQLAHLADALFPEPGLYDADVAKMVYNLAVTALNNKRTDFILDFLIVPVTPNYRSEVAITCGGRQLAYEHEAVFNTVKGNPIDDAFVDFNCGSITLPEYWANFLDFSGTRIKLFLPYVGYVDVQPEYINGGNLKVWYRFNVFDGSFMAYVESSSGHSELDQSLIAQYAGVAAIHIPIQSQDYSNKISGLISAMGTVAAGATGGISPASTVGAAASAANTLVQKPGSTHANGYNASSSYLSHRKPYLIIERQSSQFSEKYPEEKGLPLFVKATINDCHGLTVCDNPHLDTIPATMEEKERIYKYLTEGIIV